MQHDKITNTSLVKDVLSKDGISLIKNFFFTNNIECDVTIIEGNTHIYTLDNSESDGFKGSFPINTIVVISDTIHVNDPYKLQLYEFVLNLSNTLRDIKIKKVIDDNN